MRTSVELGSLAEIITGPFGSELHKSDYVTEGIPWIMPQNISERSLDYSNMAYINANDANRLKKYRVKTNDLVYARRGNVEKHAFITEQESGAICGTGCMIIRAENSNIVPAFLSFFLNRPESKRWITLHAVGSNMLNINTDILSSIPIKYPSTKEQNYIICLLQKLEDKIKINKQINDNLQKQLCLIYENMMRNAQYGSVEGTFTIASKLTDVLTGKEDANFASSKGKYKFFTCSNDTLNCDEYVFDNSAIMIAGNGDFNVKHYSGKFNAYQRTYVLIPNHKYYGLLYLASLYQINSFKSASSGSIVKFVTKGDIENISVFVPKDERILNELNRLLVLQENNQSENEELSSLRDWLLPMLMNGQATIED